jgi:hypothetical protein
MDTNTRYARPAWSRGLAARVARAAAVVVLGLHAALAAAGTSILFIGNSFTYGALSDVEHFRADTVTDLNATGIGGVPALFKAFTQQAGLDYQVSLETEPGSGLDFHWNNRLTLIDKPWDKVVMHGQSTLDFGAPGDPGKVVTYSGLLSEAFHARNPAVDVSLTATWARADQTYLPTGHWYGQPISAMAHDVQAGYDLAKAVNGALIDRVNPVGLAWNRAMEVGVADSNPYDGITAGQLDLWASDHYHASNYGYYLHALTVFGMVTGVDPRALGGTENAAAELGFSASEAYALQSIAWQQIHAIPEPSSYVLMALGVGVVLLAIRRRKRRP